MARKGEKRTTAAPAPKKLPGEGVEERLDRHGFWIALLGIAVLLVLFFHPVFFEGKGFLPPDSISSMAHRPYIEESMHGEGSLLERYPLWTPYIFSGMPSFGSLIAAPYTNPMSFLLTPIPGVFKVITYYLLLGIFSWLFLRRQGVGTLVALVGAAAYIFCAHLITMIMFGHNSKIATLVFLPLVLLATQAIWQRPTLRWTSILAAAVGTMLVTSHLQISYYTLLAAGLFLVVMTGVSLREGMKVPAVVTRWGVWAGGFLLGLAASAVIFLPVHEYAAHSIRGAEGGGLTYSYATSWSFHPLEITTFFIPSFAGFGQSTYWGWMPFTDFPHYSGILILFLAVMAIVLWPRKPLHVYLLVLALASLLLAFGKHVPLFYGFMFKFFPYFNKFRVPSMILVLFQFAVAMLAALGLGGMLAAQGAERERARRLLLRVGAVFLLVLIVLGGLVVSGGLTEAMQGRLAARVAGRLDPSQLGTFLTRMTALIQDMVAKDALVGLFVLAGGIALLWAALRRRVAPVVAVVGVLILTLIDLWQVDHRPASYQPRASNPDAFAPTGAVQFLQQDKGPYRILPLVGGNLNNNWFAYFRIQSILGYHPAKLTIYQALIDDQGPVGISKQLSLGNFNIVNMLNMKYVVADQEIQAGPLRTVYRGDGVVMENPLALPRLWFADSVVVIPSETEHLAALSDPGWSPATTAYLFEDPGPLDPGAGGRAVITRYAPREIHAQVESPGRSLLVMSEIYYEPGWYAWLDGEPIDVLRSDYVLRAFVVPPGEHELKLRFDPPVFREGVSLSVAAYAAILVLLGASFVLERRRRSAPPGTA